MALIDDLRLQLGMGGQLMSPEEMLAIPTPQTQLPPQLGQLQPGGDQAPDPRGGIGLGQGGGAPPDPGSGGGITIRNDEELEAYKQLARQLQQAQEDAKNPSQVPRGMSPAQTTVQSQQGGIPNGIQAESVAVHAAEEQANKRVLAERAEQQ